MAWYDTGTVSVTNGSTAVTGVGTNFISGAQIGEAFYGPDDTLYEIQAIVSATSLTLADSYLGATQSGQSYKIIPTQSLVASLTTQVSSLITDFQDVKDEAGAGKFNDGTAALPGITFNLDQDIGFSRPAANQLATSTGGVRRSLLSNTAYQVDVPITGTAVQSDFSDTTTGRLMPVGAFGLGNVGGIAAPSDNANLCLIPGLNYRFTSSGLNCPVGNPFGSSLQVFSGAGTRIQQVFLHTQNGNIWFRTSTDSGATWSTWLVVFTQANILGTVSQSGGVPTGAVVERGSNANGEYVRFADGTQICAREVAGVNSNVAAGNIFTSTAATANFPATFVGGSAVYPAGGTKTAAAWANVRAVATSNWSYTIFSAASRTGDDVVLIAHGRWF